MKNFFRFLLVLVGVILLYIYNNPDVIDKYKTAGTSTERDSSQVVDSTFSDTSCVNVSVVDSTNMKATVSDSLGADSLVVDTVKPRVNLDTFVYSSKLAKAYLGRVDSSVKKTLTPYFKVENNNGVDWYYAKTAPICCSTKMVRCDHDAFFTKFGVENGKVCSSLYLHVSITRKEGPFVISKIFVVADDHKFDITSELSRQEKNMFFHYVNYNVALDSDKYNSLAWVLYNAKEAKILYVDNGNPEEMKISKEELDYVRHGINMYIACGQCCGSKL